eukprot:SAG31_NODE_2646_length_5307_cov_1.777074_3_plen_64_part_00
MEFLEEDQNCSVAKVCASIQLNAFAVADLDASFGVYNLAGRTAEPSVSIVGVAKSGLGSQTAD